MKTGIFSSKLFTTLLTICILLGIIVSVAACNIRNNEDDTFADLPPLYGTEPEEPEEPEEIIRVESVDINLENTVVRRGDSLIPTITFFPHNATDQTYTLHSYDTLVLQQRGDRFVAIGSGEAEIIVTAADGTTAWISITVIVPVQRVTLDEREITLDVGESRRLTATIIPADAIYSTSLFSSSNPNVATVSQFGTIEALAVGSTEITFTADGVSASMYVTVEIPVTGVNLSVNREFFTVGDEGTFTVGFTPENATNQTYEVTFSDGIELVDGNRFAATAAGTREITVTTEGGFSASATITIIDLELLATEVFEFTNVERVRAGLPAFVNLSQLRSAAQTRSVEIISYFSHSRPDGRSCFTVLPESNVTYLIAGENIAMGQRTAAEVVEAWMNSPGHRENILRSDFAQLGIGVSMDSNGVLYWAQMFID